MGCVEELTHHAEVLGAVLRIGFLVEVHDGVDDEGTSEVGVCFVQVVPQPFVHEVPASRFASATLW